MNAHIYINEYLYIGSGGVQKSNLTLSNYIRNTKPIISQQVINQQLFFNNL